MSCEPLCTLDPSNVAALGKAFSGYCLGFDDNSSQWVEKKYKDFSKLVGFSLVGLEGPCKDMLRRIENARLKNKRVAGPNHTGTSSKKGARELRNLVSLVNYEGRQNS